MQKLFLAGLLIIFTGFGLILAGSVGQGNTSTGGVVFIGPFPIVFGSGPSGWPLALGSLVIGGMMLLLLIVWGWRLSGARGD